MTPLSSNRKNIKQNFLEHINKLDPVIKFTVESNQQNVALPFLDTTVKPEADNTLSLTNQYLQWDSHHNLVAKYSVISTLTHKAWRVCTKPELLNQEMQQFRKALTKCKCPKWAFDKRERKFISNNQEESDEGNNQREQSEGNTDNTSGKPEERDSTKDRYNKGHIIIPYMQGLGESIKNICMRYGIQTLFKGNRTIKNMLVKPKHIDPLDRKSGTIYWCQCGELTCNEEYIGETSRAFGERYKEKCIPHPSMDIATFQDIAPTLTTSPS